MSFKRLNVESCAIDRTRIATTGIILNTMLVCMPYINYSASNNMIMTGPGRLIDVT